MARKPASVIVGSGVELPAPASDVETVAAAPEPALAPASDAAPAPVDAPAPIVAPTSIAANSAPVAEDTKIMEAPLASLGQVQDKVRTMIETGITESRSNYSKVKGILF